MTAENRRLLAQGLIQLERFDEAIAEYESLRKDTIAMGIAEPWEKALYTFEYAQLMEQQGQYGEGLYKEALGMEDTKAHARICALGASSFSAFVFLRVCVCCEFRSHVRSCFGQRPRWHGRSRTAPGSSRSFRRSTTRPQRFDRSTQRLGSV